MHSSSSFTEGEKLQGRRRSLAGLAAEAYPATVPVCPGRLMHDQSNVNMSYLHFIVTDHVVLVTE